MALRHLRALQESEYQSPCRGLGNLYDPSVSTGTDFTLTTWAGQIINVQISGTVDATACWFETTGQTITTSTVITAPAQTAADEATIRANGFLIEAGKRNEFLVPTSDLGTPVVVLRIVSASAVSVRIDRASLVS